MGRASKWLKGLFGMNNKDNNSKNGHKQCENLKFDQNGVSEKKIEKKRWSFCKSGKGNDNSGEMNQIPVSIPAVSVSDGVWLRSYMSETEKEHSKHAIAVAAASAAAADAAVAAAHAAVAVVRLTNSSHGRGTMFNGGAERWAALKIQIHFRGYLARKALRALKGLVKLQAVVRGYLVRKRAAATLHSMQALFRAQCSARSQRSRLSIPTTPDFRGRRSTERFDEPRTDFYSRRFSASHEVSPFNNSFEDNPKIVEIDTFKPRSRSRRIKSAVPQTMPNHYGEEYHYPPISSPLPLPTNPKKFQDFEWAFTGDDYRFTTAQSTPRFTNSIRSNVLATPAKSVCGDAFFRPYYSNYPSYMASTQSFKAKSRSHSAPKQRPEPGQKKRLSLNELMASRTSFSGVKMQRSCSHAQETFNS